MATQSFSWKRVKEFHELKHWTSIINVPLIESYSIIPFIISRIVVLFECVG